MNCSAIAASNLPKADNGFSETSADLVGSFVLLNHTGRESGNFKVFPKADKWSAVLPSLARNADPSMEIVNNLPPLFARHQPRQKPGDADGFVDLKSPSKH